MSDETNIETIWRAIFSGQMPELRRGNRLRAMLPAKTRCKNCNAPLDGLGSFVMRRMGRGRYHKNPRFCDF